MVTPVPTLSTRGWVTSPPEKADMLISHFFSAMTSQSYIYNSNISNIHILLQKYAHSPVDLSDQLRKNLVTYLERYYTEVAVDVTTKDIGSTNKVELIISAELVDNGKRYSLARLLSINNSKFDKISKLNNYGNT